MQCVAKQNQFKTLNLVTRLDSTGKTWTITGQAENIAAGTKTQRNQVTTYFYDSKGNNVGGGSYQGAVNPSILKSLQSAAFNFKASTSMMRGTQPSFLRLEYELRHEYLIKNPFLFLFACILLTSLCQDEGFPSTRRYRIVKLAHKSSSITLSLIYKDI
jgi:hypothetical protein